MSPRPTFIATTVFEGITMSSEALISTLKSLKLYGMAQAVDDLAQQSAPAFVKTHLATAIGIQAIIHQRLRVRFFSSIELVNTLARESQCQAGASR